jgi:hypothetical protein
MFHYVLGSKYFPENRYRLLYHCAAIAEAESGRQTFVARRTIRNLATNEVEPASDVLADPAPCRAAFSPERWDEFRQDVERFRSSDYPGSWSAIFRDHGYNATPVWTAVGGWIAGAPGASPARLAAIDFVLYVVLFAAIVWAFGADVGALAVLVWGVGLPWQYSWTGGAFARASWLALTVGALCLVRRSRFGAGGAALAGAALLRVFPAAFAAGPALLALRDAVRSRRIPRRYLHMAAGAAASAAVLLALAAWRTGGLDTWLELRDNLVKHAASPSGNDIGLAAIFAWDPDNTQAEVLAGGRLDDYARWERGRHEAFAARRPLYFVAAAAMLAGFTALVLRTARAEWEALAMGVLVVLAVAEISSYYLVLFLLLAPFAAARPRRVALLAAAAAGSQLPVFSEPSADTLYFVQSIVFVGAAIALFVDVAWVRTKRKTAHGYA